MLPVYRGVKHQYGYGLGSIFKTALKTVTPLIKPLVKSGFNAIKKKVSNREYAQQKISLKKKKKKSRHFTRKTIYS